MIRGKIQGTGNSHRGLQAGCFFSGNRARPARPRLANTGPTCKRVNLRRHPHAKHHPKTWRFSVTFLIRKDAYVICNSSARIRYPWEDLKESERMCATQNCLVELDSLKLVSHPTQSSILGMRSECVKHSFAPAQHIIKTREAFRHVCMPKWRQYQERPAGPLKQRVTLRFSYTRKRK